MTPSEGSEWMKMDRRRRWFWSTIECVLAEYKEKKGLLTEKDIRECLKVKGVRSTGTVDGNIEAARNQGFLYDLKLDAEKLQRFEYLDLKHIRGRGRFIPTVTALLVYKAREIARRIFDDNDELVLIGINTILDALDDELYLMERAVIERYLEELEKSGLLSHRWIREGTKDGSSYMLIIRINVPEEHWKIECRGNLKEWERIVECVEEKSKSAPESVRAKLSPPNNVKLVRNIARIFRESLNGNPHPIPPSSVNWYYELTDSLIGLAIDRLSMMDKIDELEVERIKNMLSKGEQA
jgi:hypothetical protein